MLTSQVSGAKVYLVGTAHFSKESCEDVSLVIQAVQPDIVMVELCKQVSPPPPPPPLKIVALWIRSYPRLFRLGRTGSVICTPVSRSNKNLFCGQRKKRSDQIPFLAYSYTIADYV